MPNNQKWKFHPRIRNHITVNPVQTSVFIKITSIILSQRKIMGMIDRSIRAVHLLISQLNHFAHPYLIFGKIHIRIRIFLPDISAQACIIIGKKRQLMQIAFFRPVALLIIQPVNRIFLSKIIKMRF